MDRDMVNCLHYLYQWNTISQKQIDETNDKKRLFWCGPDTSRPLDQRNIVLKDDNSYTLLAGVYELLDMIEDQLRTLPKPDYTFGYPISAPIRSQDAVRPAFLAISYAPEFKPVKQIVKKAATKAGFKCEVTEDLNAPGNIIDHVWQGIRSSDVVVADITTKNANVFYEIGLSHALGKEVILISQDPEAPFDISPLHRITYDIKELGQLQTDLINAFHAVTARYPHEGDEPRF